jgi:hypothetical protein
MTQRAFFPAMTAARPAIEVSFKYDIVFPEGKVAD